MAEKTLAGIAAEASHRFGTDRITVLHRVGKLRVGEVSTAIAVATPHRGEAYEASRFIIEELKQRLPIWKREHYLEGDSHWVGGSMTADVEGPKRGASQDEGRGK
jgi:molybdopterin synthase catalytic subunit